MVQVINEFTVMKKFKFDAAHRLYGYDGKCKNIHGHTYVADVTLEGTKLNELALLVDFGDMKKTIGKWIDDNWDHSIILNKLDPLVNLLQAFDSTMRIYVADINPTAEWMAYHLKNMIQRMLGHKEMTSAGNLMVDKVHIWETTTACAGY